MVRMWWAVARCPLWVSSRPSLALARRPSWAAVVGRLKPAIILWTTKFGAVVDQTVANLHGKYRHLVGKGGVEVLNFGEVASPAQWEHILDRKDCLTVIVSDRSHVEFIRKR